MEPEKNRPELNEEQRKAAFCTENAVVAAGAGSGKTMVLASRFAWLVTEKKYRVDEILTLTFTKKAAAQMYRRIYTLLGEIAKGDSGAGGTASARKAAQNAAQKALDDFTRARIQTLDSYSAALVKQAASRYGISPDFTIDEGRCRDLAVEESLSFLIAHRRHEAVERLYPQMGPDAVARSVFAAALFKYGGVDPACSLTGDMRKQFDIIRAEWKRQTGEIKNLLRELAAHIAGDNALLPDLVPLMAQFSSGGLIFPGEPEIRAYFDLVLNGASIPETESHPLRPAIVKVLEFLSALKGLNLRKGKRGENPAKELIYRIRNAVFGEFSSLAVFCMQAGLSFSFMTLLEKLRQRYLHKKRSEGILTFSDVSALARTILLEQEDIRQSEKEAFKAIMIDEFQDNNEPQKDLLFLLAEKPELAGRDIPRAEDLSPGKLFFVGDEKQSIYRFRGADVSVFRALRDELQSADLPLRINYRSAPRLIGAFNAIFGGSGFDPAGTEPLSEHSAVFAPGITGSAAGGGLPLYEAAYTPLRSGRDTGGRLTLCVLDKKDESETEGGETDRLTPVENEARFVAERIRRLLEKKNAAGEPEYRPDDIAILFRTHGPQHLFEKQLRELNIPYASEDLNGFFFGGLVNDIMSVLRLAAYPLDPAAYAEMLRSPFAGLSLPGVAVCLAVFNSAESPEPFAEDPLPRLAEEDRAKYRQGRRVYLLIREKAAVESVSALIDELWYGQGYRYETEWNSQTAVYRELYDYLFHLAAQADADNRGLAAFTDMMQSLRDDDERLTDIEIPLERPSAVHLLTVHKSKGLEFPVVFLCCCDKYSKRGAGTGEVYDTGDAGITFNPPLPSRCSAIPGIRRNFFWERSVAEEKRKKTAELRRLLYVAMTRAKNELYLTGCLGIGKDENPEAENFDENSASGGFSRRLKDFINKKTEKAAGKNAIPGDRILDDDTFFGLCLPALTGYIPSGDSAGEPPFFSIEAIPPFTKESRESAAAFLSNSPAGLSAFIEKTEPLYRNAQAIITPEPRNNHLTPVSLRKKSEILAKIFSGQDFVISKEFSGDDAADVFEKVDTILARYAGQNEEGGEKFNPGSFGTIAHACAEALLNGKEAEIPPALAGFLSPKDAGAFLEAGKELALRFVGSPLGKIAQSAELRESEFSFRTLTKDSSGNEIFISGTVDLFFGDRDAIHVVDFKTDSQEFPGEHTAQMACYYQAASALFAEPAKKECRVWLYYLRTGHAVEMTQKVKEFSIK